MLEIYGKEYDVHWGEVTNTFTKVRSLAKCSENRMVQYPWDWSITSHHNTQATRIVARAWIQGKAWAGKGENRDEARSKLIKYLKVQDIWFVLPFRMCSQETCCLIWLFQHHEFRIMWRGIWRRGYTPWKMESSFQNQHFQTRARWRPFSYPFALLHTFWLVGQQASDQERSKDVLQPVWNAVWKEV